MQRGADLCAAALHALASDGLNTVTAMLGSGNELIEWQHYPGENDVFDRRTGSQYYFHCHSAGKQPEGEHGHFHLFGRDDYDASIKARGREQPCTHLLGISVNSQGLPTRLFTTNRWVTDEQWLPGPQVLALIDTFSISTSRPSPALHRWLRGMLLLFRPQIENLIVQRDKWLDHASRSRPAAKVMEDRRTHVVSTEKVAFFEQIEAIYGIE